MQHAPGSAGSGVGARLRSYAADAIGILQTRLELFATEVAEEKLRLGAFLGYAAVAFFFLGFGVVLLALLVTVLLWDSHRLLALGIFTTLFLVIGTVAALFAARIHGQASRLFTASISELEQDRDMIRPDNESPDR